MGKSRRRIQAALRRPHLLQGTKPMIGLAWDDQPEHDNYIVKLREALERRNVILSVYKNEDQFVEKLFEKKWDFIVTDLLKSLRPDASVDDDKLHGENVGIA